MNLENSPLRRLWDNGVTLAAVGILSVTAVRNVWGDIHVGGIEAGYPTIQFPLAPSLFFGIALVVFLVSGVRNTPPLPRRVFLMGMALLLVLTTPPGTIPPTAIHTFLEKSGIHGKAYIDPLWRKIQFPSTLSPVSDVEGADLAVIPHNGRPLPVRGWITLFENNLGIVSLRVREGNLENLRAAQAYYAAEKVDFDPRRGFEMGKAFACCRDWTKLMQDRWPAGSRVSRDRLSRDALSDASVYLSRGTKLMAIDRIAEAIEADPHQPHLAVYLQQVLLETKNFAEAQKWQEVIDAMAIPPELLTATQHARYVLLKEHFTK